MVLLPIEPPKYSDSFIISQMRIVLLFLTSQGMGMVLMC
jgi:hypothetical protein